ncbi:hypothetical protein DMC14_000890 [Metamycoplasma phocicerebrale]|uniref:Uncharacterized protein n=1 Tax=Metamycoplasma phocicerebrale TaxID=142649 RepID=A0A3T0TTP8_9BACT|nr:hypothetical protein [Metamycoplasma phocicerebrale]AZZ65349.1 hypothetical protein DMC14_000890 [Metamycoplasma phocicerebrale]
MSEEKIESNLQNIKTKKTKFYYFLKDKTFIWTIFSFIIVFFMVISFLNIKGLTTIHSYTFGMFFGMFSIAIYIVLLLVAFKKIFKMKNTYSVGVFHFSLLRISLIVFSLIMLGTAIYYTKNKPDLYSYKNAISKIMSKWYIDFKYSTASPEDAAWLPYKWTPGAIFSILHIFSSFLGKTAGMVISYIVSIILFCLSFTTLFISDKKFVKLIPSKFRKDRVKIKTKVQKNINVSLDKQEAINNNLQTKEEIVIKQLDLTNKQESLMLESIKTNEMSFDTNTGILLEEPDFSTQEFEVAMQTEMKENNSFFKKNETEINVNYQLNNSISKINEDTISDLTKEEEIDISKDSNASISFEEESELLKDQTNIKEPENFFTNENAINNKKFFKSNETEINKKSSTKKTKRFSIIEDKEDLF